MTDRRHLTIVPGSESGSTGRAPSSSAPVDPDWTTPDFIAGVEDKVICEQILREAREWRKAYGPRHLSMADWLSTVVAHTGECAGRINTLRLTGGRERDRRQAAREALTIAAVAVALHLELEDHGTQDAGA